ncbi:ribosomal-protein-alanine N-acetyltransferase [Georgenia satyanarayanai]|uniref:[Ribosomal protein bS18]-alanine N-acetyltransferase n=1 Tax=Georgenia satyanarayanai TaxID=860221 RepID=A0A2Y9C4R7_9MICO|nr:ribosomal protein S18-alanine N-acetyltransferase [Georgenia satyanarayanai]PYG00664.1 ribosomal-protein-alanine N-acetyltransferase [Georgenia satyanarayanai]SSA40053.1 ribosomal-protein-alanine N-acetyltransferase [Georgenia satyanarayanai]
MILRPLREEDLDRVMELEHELFGRGAWSRAVYRTELGQPGRYYVAAESDGVVVGYAGIALAQDSEVMTVGVASGYRGRGTGAALLADLIERARVARARHVFLEVRAGNTGAQRLYERAGFAPIGTRPRYYGDEDAVVMRLTLRTGQGDLTAAP